ncbi:MAG: Mut7-C RNAse domain-containing protein [Desulfobulbaceae bacterium]|nr:Mut7-C RNAse domain-containing protein [Desulfobulbaceae bacterium]
MSAVFEFHGDLPGLLRAKWRGRQPVVQPVQRRASIKDVVESFGVPHTEIGTIECRGEEVDFSYPVEDDRVFKIFPIRAPWDPARKSLLRPVPLAEIKFIVDVNVGRLARYLRMAGFDVLYHYRWSDVQIIAMISRERRIVITRDLALLKRRQVEFGRYVRSEKPAEQLHEIIGFFGLRDKLQPFSRCLDCNTLLEPVAKQDILHLLEPLTKKYYHSFSICPACDKVYWAGSHVEEMRQLFPGYF